MSREALARLRALVAALPPGGSMRGPSHLGRCPVLLRGDLEALLEELDELRDDHLSDLSGVVYQFGLRRKDGTYGSGCLSEVVMAMEALAEAGRVEIVWRSGRNVHCRFLEDDDE